MFRSRATRFYCDKSRCQADGELAQFGTLPAARCKLPRATGSSIVQRFFEREARENSGYPSRPRLNKTSEDRSYGSRYKREEGGNTILFALIDDGESADENRLIDQRTPRSTRVTSFSIVPTNEPETSDDFCRRIPCHGSSREFPTIRSN